MGKYINDTFGALTQPFIRNTMKNKNTCALELVILYETGHKNATETFRVLSCLIYTIIENYVFIDYIYCLSKKLSEICLDRKYPEKVLTNSWV